MSRKLPKTLGIICLALLAAPYFLAPKVSAEPNWSEWSKSERTVVVELYTSQGCSSCPPADALLQELSSVADKHDISIFPMSFHVDYWDSLGWKDPYGGRSATERQRKYQEAFASRNVYTPQLIVAGQSHFVGSSRSKLYDALEQQFLIGRDSVNISARQKNDNALARELLFSSIPKNAVLRIAYLNREEKNAVDRGENSGSTLSHRNVVSGFESVPITSERMLLKLKREPSALKPVIVFIQLRDSMKIHGALKL